MTANGQPDRRQRVGPLYGVEQRRDGLGVDAVAEGRMAVFAGPVLLGIGTASGGNLQPDKVLPAPAE